MPELKSPYPITLSFDNHPINVITDEHGEPWWFADQICDALDIKDHRNSTHHLDDDEKRVSTRHTLGGTQQVTTINESGLYSLILRSRKPEAKRFKRWVTHEVLPSIRKTGSYGQADVLKTITDALVPALQGITSALASITTRLDAIEKRETTVEHTTRVEHRPAPQPASQRDPIPRGRLHAPAEDGPTTDVPFEGTAQLGSAGVPSWGKWNLFGRQASFRVIVPDVRYCHHARLKQLMWEAGVVKFRITRWNGTVV